MHQIRVDCWKLSRCWVRFAGGLLICLGAVVGCSSQPTAKHSLDLSSPQGQWRELQELEQKVLEDPGDVDARQKFERRRVLFLNRALDSTRDLINWGDLDTATKTFAIAEKIGGDAQRISAVKSQLFQARHHVSWLRAAQAGEEATRPTRLRRAVTAVLRENPEHEPAKLLQLQLERETRSKPPEQEISLPSFSGLKNATVHLAFRNAAISDVFEAISQMTGMNFVFDQAVKTSTKVTLSLNEKPVEDVLKLITSGNGLAYVAIDAETAMIFPDVPEKMREHMPTIIRTFYLENAIGQDVRDLLSSILGMDGIYVDERLNLLIVRDSPDRVAMVQEMLKSIDLAEPEVVLELEVLEVTRTRLREIGIRYPDSIGLSVQGVNGAGSLTLPEFQDRNSSMARLRFNDPLAVLNLKSSKGDAALLANPRIRIRNNTSANVLVGERVPVITTTTTANVGTSESVNYLDVGLKLDIEPVIAPNDEVSMFIDLEVSSIVGEVVRASGLQAYRVGTRNASTSLRVRDGETQVLGGLIQRDERNASTGVPWLSDLPLIGRLFSNDVNNGSETEIILLITPRVVRNVPKNMLGGVELEMKFPPPVNRDLNGSPGSTVNGGRSAGSTTAASGRSSVSTQRRSRFQEPSSRGFNRTRSTGYGQPNRVLQRTPSGGISR